MIYSATPIKRTKVEHTVNTQIIFLFLILIVISVSCSFGAFFRQLNNPFESQILFLPPDYNEAVVTFGKNIVTYIILFNNLIPLR
jgi:phospholipid-transporting ATPase